MMIVSYSSVILSVCVLWSYCWASMERCGSIDIRANYNWAQQENPEWHSCNIADGDVKIAIISDNKGNYKRDNYRSLSNLTHITGFLLVYTCKNLNSVGKIFPNLRVIGGHTKLEGYSLIIFDNSELKEVGLHNLTEITEGGVRIARNRHLCFADTIDWTKFYRNPLATTMIYDNQKPLKCANTCSPVDETGCVRNETLPDKPLLCWNLKHCQRVCPKHMQSGCWGSAIDPQPCHPLCKAGCFGNRTDQCHMCRYVLHHGVCFHKCPNDYYLLNNRTCLSWEECRTRTEVNKMGNLVNYHPMELKNANNVTEKVCLLECPIGYEDDEKDPTKCNSCNGPCPKECMVTGTVTDITSPETTKYKHCNILHGNLEIQMITKYRGNIVKVLEEIFQDVYEVTGSLTINFSPSITTLHMFRNLRRIGRTLDPKTKPYSLVILENDNLGRLFPDPHLLRIYDGKIRIVNNRLLCPHEVDELIGAVNFSDKSIQASEEEMKRIHISNGDKAICDTSVLKWGSVNPVRPGMVMLNWAPFNTTDQDHRMFLGYRVYYKIVEGGDPEDVDVFENRDSCFDSWNSETLVNTDVRGKLITHLKSYTFYAFYVETRVEKSAGAKGAKTNVAVVRTLFDKPSDIPFVEANTLSHDQIELKWKRPQKENGVITHYKIQYKQDVDKMAQGRDYCDSAAPRALKEKETLSDLHNDAQTCAAKECCECVVEEETRTDKVREIDKRIHKERNEFENAVINTIFVQSCKKAAVFTILPKHCRHTGKNRKRRDNESSTNVTEIDDLHDALEMGERRLQNLLKTLDFLPTEDKPGYEDFSLEEVKRFRREIAEEILEQRLSEQEFEEKEENLKLLDNAKESSEEDWITINVTNADAVSYIFTGLNHYSSYLFTITACQDPQVQTSFCSNTTKPYEARTKPIRSNDRVNAELISVNNSTEQDSLTRVVSWSAPLFPNGPVTHYKLMLQSVDSQQSPIIKCVTTEEFNRNGHKTSLHGVHPGNYSLKVQAVSLLAELEKDQVVWSVAVYFHVQSSAIWSTHQTILVAILGPITVVIICAALFWFMQHRFKKKLMTLVITNPDYISSLDVYKPDEWELSRSEIHMLHEIGRGTFGTVYLGEGKQVQSVNGITFGPCAIKTVAESASHFDRLTFLVEASVMKQFSSPHIVKLYGVVSDGQPALVVMEMMHLGNLRDYLRSRRPGGEENDEGLPPPSTSECLLWAAQIADGMSYLESIKFCHRDLAARNCMVAKDRTCKIGDFGMARDVYVKDYYKPTGKRLMPVRWMAPESLRDAKFTSKSDVWSYGVVLWEISTLAQQPYSGLDNDSVMEYVRDTRQTLKVPTDCPKVLSDLMHPCWQYDYRLRPTFANLVATLINTLQNDHSHAAHRFRQVSFIYNGLARRQEESPAPNSPSPEQQFDSDSPLNPENDSPPREIHVEDVEMKPVGPVCNRNRRMPWNKRTEPDVIPENVNGRVANSVSTAVAAV